MGGAGTGAGGPPDDPVLPDEPLDDELDDEEELDEELPDELPVEPLLPPVLDVLVLEEPFDDQPPEVDQPWLDEP